MLAFMRMRELVFGRMSVSVYENVVPVDSERVGGWVCVCECGC